MSECHHIIEEFYKDDNLKRILSKINPASLQDDLRQEFFLILLEYDCNELLRIKSTGNLTGFMLRILWNMAYSSTHPFYYKFKKSNLKEAIEYFRVTSGKDIKLDANKAQNILDKKLEGSAKDAHESIIFQKYVEFRNCVKVAEYFGIPQQHVFEVVKQTKKQLKHEINNRN